MEAAMEEVAWFRWLVTALLAALAIVVAAVPRSFLAVRPALARTLGQVGPADRERLERALAARRSVASWPLGFRVVSVAGFVALALVTATTRVPIVLPFVIGALWMTIVQFALYERERPVSAGGEAPALEVVPPYVFAVSLIAALTPVSYFDVAPAATALVLCSLLVMIGLAAVVARRPPSVRGDDVPVEAFIEQRVRYVRVTNMLTAIPNSAMLFMTLSLVSYPISTARLLAVLLALACSLVGLIAYLIGLRAPSRATFSALDTARGV
jgi:hypothetical protein